MSPTPVKSSFQQLNHDEYNEHTHQYLREVSTDPPDEVTEFLNDLETTDESIAVTSSEGLTAITEMTQMHTEMTQMHTETIAETTFSALELTTIAPDASSSESSQTILIVLGILLAILLIVCCVLVCIFAKIRRKGFCTVEGTNQATCNDDCQEDAASQQQSPKESMTSAKSEHSRSSDKLLTK